jgi:ribonuclease HI
MSETLTRKRKLDDSFGSMRERGTSAGDGSGPKTRYHLLATDGGIVPDQPGKMAGEAAIGVVLKSPLEEISEPIGPAKDHHVAEYRALIRGLEAARSRGIGHLRVCLDSALLVDQLNDRSKVKAEHLKPLHKQAVSLIDQFADIKITWVPREANAEADALASTPLGPLRPPGHSALPLGAKSRSNQAYGAGGTRTPDLSAASRTLFQLSYSPWGREL